MHNTNSVNTILYRVRKMRVTKRDGWLFDYCDTVTADANNLSNAVRFRQRQVLTAVRKNPDDWTPNEREIMDEIRDALPRMGGKFRMPTEKACFLSYTFLEKLLCVTDNPDRRRETLPNHTAQETIRSCVRDMKSFFASVREYGENPGRFTAKPELPGYRRKGGRCTATISNEEGVLHEIGGMWFLKLPYRAQKEFRVPFGESVPGCRFKMAKITPDNGSYVLSIVLDCGELPQPEKKPERIAAVDTGVENLMAVANNCGLPGLLYKGGVCKSVNRLYNKKAAAIVSAQTSATGKKFVPTPEFQKLTLRRNDRIGDILLKTAKHFVTWCVENRIDTIVFGANERIKQDVALGDANTQNFVQIPFAKLRDCARYMAEREGIRYVEQEESYTSRASFPDSDYIPVYGKDDNKAAFSGHRAPTRYKGMYRKNGFRGLYRTEDGTVINSDLNGAANILRKAFPDAFDGKPDIFFEQVVIIRHPDEEADMKLRILQTAAVKTVSKAKQKRLRRKGKGNPTGIGLCG